MHIQRALGWEHAWQGAGFEMCVCVSLVRILCSGGTRLVSGGWGEGLEAWPDPVWLVSPRLGGNRAAGCGEGGHWARERARVCRVSACFAWA